MDERVWESRYIQAINSIAPKIGSIRGIIVAYNTNIDAIYYVKPQFIERIASPLMDKIIGGFKRPPGKILDKKDFFIGLLSNMKHGLGEEWLIHNADIVNWLKSTFRWDRLKMGGQAGNMSNVLTNLGVPLVVPHVAQLSKDQAELFINEGRIRVPRVIDGEVTLVSLKEAVRSEDDTLIHFVFEFESGQKLSIGNLVVNAPRENRFVATYDEYNTRLHIEPAFLKGVTLVKQMDGAMMSGYHFLHETHIDRIDISVEQIRDWKRINPELSIHLEMGDTQNNKVMRVILEKLSPVIDSLGLNEYELIKAMESLGYSDKSVKDANGFSVTGLYKTAISLLNITSVKRVTVHTKDLSIRIIHNERNISPKFELHSLLFGSAVAADYAAKGEHRGVEEILRHMDDYRLSLEGLKQFKVAARSLHSDEKYFLSNGYIKMGNYWMMISVNRNVENPVLTAGLGDAFTATTFLADLAVKCSINSNSIWN